MRRRVVVLRALLPVGTDVSAVTFAARHRLVLCGIVVQLPVLVLIGVLNGESGSHLVSELALLVGLTAAAASPRLVRAFRVALSTTALVGCSAMLVHLTGGLTESHFHFFAVVAFVTLYQSWLPYLLCLAWVLLHHGVLGMVAPESVYSNPAAVARPALWALVHGAFVVLASLAGLAAWRATEVERLRAESVLTAAPHPLYGLDTDGRILFANRALADLVGREQNDLIGLDGHTLLHPGSGTCQLCQLLTTGGEHHLGQVELRGSTGEPYPAELHMRPILERGRRLGTVVTHWDITERLGQRRQLERLALHDTLTGLANRTLTRDRLSQALLAAEHDGTGVAVIFIDLDRFKPVNDALGHRAGDQLLVAIAERLLQSARPQDTVARVGGDEFVVVAPGVCDAVVADALGERLCGAVSRTVAVDGEELLVTASVGVRLATEMVDHDPERLLADADLAMFAAKARGGGQVAAYEASMRVEAGTQLNLGGELHGALRRGELVLHYQPVWDVAGDAPVGVEALVRWEHPVHGLLGPDRFIGLAEQTGMIGPIGEWVLTTAVGQLLAWRSDAELAADDLTVAVNLSVRQLQDPAFVDQVVRVLDDLPPHLLCLEVTETLLMQEGDGTTEALHRLRELGVTLAIDDFGTGFSSLATLHGLPVQQLKIDRGFVHGIDIDPDLQQMVLAIARLASALGLDVVAEGVETDAELLEVRRLACQHVQGFGLARPAPAGEVTALLRDRRPAQRVLDAAS